MKGGTMLRLVTGLCSLGIAVGVLGLAGCGSDTDAVTASISTDRGSVVYDPPLRDAALTPADFGAQLAAQAAGASLIAVAGQPACGVDIYSIQYNTVGG